MMAANFAVSKRHHGGRELPLGLTSDFARGRLVHLSRINNKKLTQSFNHRGSKPSCDEINIFSRFVYYSNYHDSATVFGLREGNFNIIILILHEPSSETLTRKPYDFFIKFLNIYYTHVEYHIWRFFVSPYQFFLFYSHKRYFEFDMLINIY